MKKTYIIPNVFSVQIETKKGMLSGSAHITLNSDASINWGGESTGGMESDTKGITSTSLWDNEW